MRLIFDDGEVELMLNAVPTKVLLPRSMTNKERAEFNRLNIELDQFDRVKSTLKMAGKSPNKISYKLLKMQIDYLNGKILPALHWFDRFVFGLLPLMSKFKFTRNLFEWYFRNKIRFYTNDHLYDVKNIGLRMYAHVLVYGKEISLINMPESEWWDIYSGRAFE